jgi:hypothetical protein
MLFFKKDFIFAIDVPIWLTQNYQVFLISSLIYPILIHYGAGKFNYYNELRIPLLIWNSIMCIYSTVSSIVLVPKLLSKIITYGYNESVCGNNIELSYLYQPWGRWIFLFILSKLVELGDTVFLILRNRKVPFIHCYHHIATLVLAYVQGIKLTKTMEWATCMNLVIHSWMYGHYAITSIYPIRGNKVLSILQICQMIHGIFMCGYQISYCNNDLDFAGFILYIIYAFLFIKMYIDKYNIITKQRIT